MSPFNRIKELPTKMLRLLIEEDFTPPVFAILISKNHAMQIDKIVESREGACFDSAFTRWYDSEEGGMQFPVRIILFDEFGKAAAMDVQLSDLISFSPN